MVPTFRNIQKLNTIQVMHTLYSMLKLFLDRYLNMAKSSLSVSMTLVRIQDGLPNYRVHKKITEIFTIMDEFKKCSTGSMTDDEIESMDGYKQATITECYKNGFCYICVKQPNTRKYGRRFGPQKMDVVFHFNTYYICGGVGKNGYLYQCTPFRKTKKNIFKKQGAITTFIKKLKMYLV